MKRVLSFTKGDDIPNNAVYLYSQEFGTSIKKSVEFYYEVPDKVAPVKRGPNIDESIAEIIGYLNDKTYKRYSSKAKANRELISSRMIADKYTVSDFKKLIDNKCGEWLGDPKWSKYLRPETLFSKKHFESYLNDTAPEQQEDDLFAELENYNTGDRK